MRTRLADAVPAHKGVGSCATKDSQGRLAIGRCSGAGGHGTGVSQQFAWDNATKQLTSTVDGLCLTAAAPAPAPTPGAGGTLIVARALAGGGVAMLLLNNGAVAAAVSCDVECFRKVGARRMSCPPACANSPHFVVSSLYSSELHYTHRSHPISYACPVPHVQAGILPSAATPVTVRDMYAHADLPLLTTPMLNITLSANGSSAALRLALKQ